MKDGQYQVWELNTAGSSKKNQGNLIKASQKMFYFHPDPILYIQHTGELEKLYRYNLDIGTGSIKLMSDYPNFDFGIGDLAFIERTDKGFLGASSSAINGYYQVVYISAIDGRTINKLSTYFKDPIVGLSFSPKKQKFLSNIWPLKICLGSRKFHQTFYF
jgi:hypothetical protein